MKKSKGILLREVNKYWTSVAAEICMSIRGPDELMEEARC